MAPVAGKAKPKSLPTLRSLGGFGISFTNDTSSLFLGIYLALNMILQVPLDVSVLEMIANTNDMEILFFER